MVLSCSEDWESCWSVDGGSVVGDLLMSCLGKDANTAITNIEMYDCNIGSGAAQNVLKKYHIPYNKYHHLPTTSHTLHHNEWGEYFFHTARTKTKSKLL